MDGDVSRSHARNDIVQREVAVPAQATGQGLQALLQPGQGLRAEMDVIHDADGAVGPTDAPKLGKKSRPVGNHAGDEGAEYHVEGAVGDGQPTSIHLAEGEVREVKSADLGVGELKHGTGEVDADDVSAGRVMTYG